MPTALPLLGVLGGMGPAATLDFLAKLQDLSNALRDQDHRPVVTFSASATPDRTAAILGRGESPLPAMQAALMALERAGVSHVAIPCNTAHYWFDDLQAGTGVRLIHIVEATMQDLDLRFDAVATVGLIATTGVVRSGIYHQRLEVSGRRVLTPPDQAAVMGVIDTIKSGRMAEALPRLAQQVRDLRDAGAEAVILGCTELPLCLSHLPAALQALCVDATEALARASLQALAESDAAFAEGVGA
ncbi:aspartate/glutamate racemase family protein [Brevundimonas sp. NPDC090276]|uniref:aspartate/glutamate racemase family protein n=1 Tax=Brevundimonas sp. NPDC090276 TaxID=3363956 RepID=UPI00383AD16A